MVYDITRCAEAHFIQCNPYPLHFIVWGRALGKICVKDKNNNEYFINFTECEIHLFITCNLVVYTMALNKIIIIIIIKKVLGDSWHGGEQNIVVEQDAGITLLGVFLRLYQ